MKNKKSVIISTNLPFLGYDFVNEISNLTNIELIIIQKIKFSFLNSIKNKIYNFIIIFLMNRLKDFKRHKILNYGKREKLLLDLCKQKNINYILTYDINNDIKVKEMLVNASSKYVLNLGGKIIKKELINLSKLIWINGHSGILPEYRGLCSEYWAIRNGDLNKLGCTIHILTEKIDYGDIIMKNHISYKKVPLYQIEYKNHINLISTYISAFKLILEDSLNKFTTFDKRNSNYYSSPKNYSIKRLII